MPRVSPFDRTQRIPSPLVGKGVTPSNSATRATRNSRRIPKPREPLRKRRQKIPESAAPHRLNPAPSGAWFDIPDPSPIRGRHDGGLWSALALEHREVNGFLGTCEQTAAMALSIEHDPPTAIVLAYERTRRSRGDPQLLFRLPHHSLQTTGDDAQLSPVPRGLRDRRFCLRLRESASPRRFNGSADGRRDRPPARNKLRRESSRPL